MQAENENGGFLPKDFGIGRLFDAVRDAVIVANARTERIVLWNPAAIALFGYTREEAMEMKLHVLVPAALVTRHRRGLANYQATGRGSLIDSDKPTELEGQHKSGRRVPVELTLSPLDVQDDEGGRFVLAIVRDRSDVVQSEEYRLRLHDAELKRRQALLINDSILQGLMITKVALGYGQVDKATEMLDETIRKTRAHVGELLEERGRIKPGSLIQDQSPEPDAE